MQKNYSFTIILAKQKFCQLYLNSLHSVINKFFSQLISHTNVVKEESEQLSHEIYTLSLTDRLQKFNKSCEHLVLIIKIFILETLLN